MPHSDDVNKAEEHYRNTEINEGRFRKLAVYIGLFFLAVISCVVITVLFRVFTGG